MAEVQQLKRCSRCKCEIMLETYFSKNRKGEYFSTCDACRASKVKITLDMCKQVAESKGGECLSTEYKNANATMEWKCSEGHQWKTKFSHIKNGTWCKKCVSISQRLTIEDCKQFADERGGMCLSDEYKNEKTKMQWRCSKNHEWQAIFNSIKSGKWCAHCAGIAPLTIDKCQQFAISKGGECLSTEYNNSKTKLLWECDKGHRWEARFDNIKFKGYWCPSCASGRSERMCREIIEKYLLEPFPTKKPDFLEGLELDGYNEELNIAFEYNGIQHYEYIPHFHRNGEQDFETQKARDRKKYRICRERKINLIIIPYQYDHTTPDELDDFIFTELCKIC